MDEKKLEEVTQEAAEEATEVLKPEEAEAVPAEAEEEPAETETAEADEEATEVLKPEEAEAVSENEEAEEGPSSEEAEVLEETAEDSEEPAEESEQDEPAKEQEASEEQDALTEEPETETSEAEAAETEETEQDSLAEKPEETEAPIIKKKKKLDKTNIIVIVVAAVIVIACLVFVGFKVGWFKFAQHGKVEVGDYSRIEVVKSEVEVTDETVQQYITSLLQSRSEKEEVREGVVEQGDELNIDYVGKLEETGEVFEGGSAKDQSLTIGSGQMIDGFESGLIGAKVGETTTIHVVFPENYSSQALAGKPASFDITVNYKSKTVAPELNDAFVKEYSSNYLDKQLNTVKEMEDYVRDYLYHYYLHSAMFDDLKTKETVKSYDAEKEEMLKQYSLDSLDYYASMYGTTAEQYASMYGFESADAYALDEAHYYLDTIMLIDRICKDKNISWTEEDFVKSVALYMARNGYSDRYTVEEFLEQSGETWRYLYENLEFKFNLAMEALEPNVVFVDAKTTAEEESTTPAAGAESSGK